MYHRLRVLHRWIGVFACLFLMLVSATGFFLSLKRSVEWIQPSTQSGSDSAAVVPIEHVYESVFALGMPEFATPADIDRVDYRPGKNVYKVLATTNYQEVQVDGGTGEVLSVSRRTDHWFEDLHDLRFFSEHLHTWVLPAVALALFGLGLSGCILFFVPVVRRYRYRKSKAA